jgi:tRNA pseudouridine38-40 synthase
VHPLVDWPEPSDVPWVDDRTGRLALVLAYQGTLYSGWQRQPHAPTVQRAVEDALSRVCARPVTVVAAGRTDAGVHARGQVVHADVVTRLTPPELTRAVNAVLPADVLVRRAGWVTENFHARYHARGKTYVYLIHTGRQRPLFTRPFVWHLARDLDLEALNRAAALLKGRRDFTSFAAAGGEVKSAVREVKAAGWQRDEAGLLVFTVMADGFLRTMVRSMVGTLVQVGSGRFTPEQISDIVAAGDRSRAGPTAPPQGLWLMHVNYQTGEGA